MTCGYAKVRYNDLANHIRQLLALGLTIEEIAERLGRTDVQEILDAEKIRDKSGASRSA